MDQRSKISKKNEYYIPEHRYLELKHRCLQYPDWIKEREEKLNELEIISKNYIPARGSAKTDPVTRQLFLIWILDDRIRQIEKAAELTDPVLNKYIIKGVTTNATYENLKLMHDIPCCRNTYYKLYRKFFWTLDKEDYKNEIS